VLEFASVEATIGVGQFEWPQEVAGLLEVGADGEYLVDQILQADDAILAEVIFDELVVCEGDALLVDLSIATLVDEFADSLQIGVAVGDVRVDDGQHLLSSLGQFDEDTAVDLKKTKKLEDLAGLRSDLVDTANMLDSPCLIDRPSVPLDSDHEDQLGLLINEEVALLSGKTSKSDLLPLGITVLLDVGLSALEDNTTLLLVGLDEIVSLRHLF
jgi:hypothetical protein